MPQLDPALLASALEGDPTAVRQLVEMLTPIVQARVARLLLRRAPAGRDIRSDVEDLTQEVFLALFADGAKTLRCWEPQRGMSFPNFVGMVAQRRAVSILRRRNPITVAALNEELPGSDDRHDGQVERDAATRQILGQLLEHLQGSLSPRGAELFYSLFVREESVEDVCARTGLKQNAVHQWRRRLGLAARRALERLQTPAAAKPRAAASAIGPVGKVSNEP